MTPWLDDGDVRLYHGDALQILAELPAGTARTCVTSPPYWGLRDYGEPYQIGLEPTPDFYVKTLVCVLREVRRVLRDDGTLWLNLGDSYASGAGSSEKRAKDASGVQRPRILLTCERCGTEFEGTAKRRFCSAFCGGIDNSPRAGRSPWFLKPKDLVGIPWRVAFALQADGWYLRSDIIWSKPNPMPESVMDRPTKAHEYLFLLAKQPRYFYDADAIREEATGTGGDRNGVGRLDGPSYSRVPHIYETGAGGRNRRSVWTIPTQPFPEAHFATYPEALVRPCILAGSRPSDLVLDPFIGSGTTALVARKHGRRSIGIDLSSEYLKIAARRLQQLSLLAEETA